MPDDHIPSDPPTPPNRQQLQSLHEDEDEDTGVVARRALRISVFVRDAIGRAPNGAIKGDTGTGLWAVLHGVQLELASTADTSKQILARLDADAAVATRRGGWASRVAWKVVESAIPIVLLALLAYLAGFHR